MSTRLLALDFIEFCQKQSDVGLIEQRFLQNLQTLGYEYVACASHVDPLRPRPRAVSVVNYPMLWLQHYSQSELAFIDPVFLATRAMPAPFEWNDVLGAMALNRQQRVMLEEGAAHGIKGGLTIPLRSPELTPASCSLVPGPDGVDSLNLPTTLTIVIFGYGIMHQRLNPGPAPQPVLLSPRERECLTLASAGKSDWVIGKLLGVSKSAAHKVVEAAKRKYGVADRIQAIVQAVFDGQISLDHLSRSKSRS